MSPDFLAELQTLADPEYRVFIQKLTPTLPLDCFLGVRMPALHTLAKDLYRNRRDQAELFMADLPHPYFEQNHLHMDFLAQERDFTAWLDKIEAFLPYINNWSVCDAKTPPMLSKHLDDLEPVIYTWLASGQVYTIRYGIGLLMNLYLDEAFQPDQLARVCRVDHEDYYVRMMVAWYMATALAKQEKAALPVLENRILPKWTHNKSIQKAVESRRIGPELKTYLKTLRIR